MEKDNTAESVDGLLEQTNACEEAGARGYGQRQNTGNSWANEHEELPGVCVCVCVRVCVCALAVQRHKSTNICMFLAY